MAEERQKIERYYRWFQRNWLNVLTAAYIGFIVYLTIVPFNFSRDPDFILGRFRHILRNPFYYSGRFGSRSDIVANLIFFAPLGMMLVLRKLLLVHQTLAWKSWLRILAWGGLISAGVEFLQVFTYNRSPSPIDIFCNAVGTVLGGLVIQSIYQGFHDILKKGLARTFVGKPEMVVAGLFLGFIFISESAPFTFNIASRSIARQLASFCHNPFLLRHGAGNVTGYLLMYAAFAYFLFTGLERYFSLRSKTRRYLLALLCCIALPFGIEIFQFLVPQRHHSMADVLLSQAGILLGLSAVWHMHAGRFDSSGTTLPPMSFYLSCHRRFFGMMGVAYLFFIFFRFFSPFGWTAPEFDLKGILRKDTSSLLYLIRYHRLDLVIDMVKEMFAFLPAGFLTALGWHTRTKRAPSLRLTWTVVILIPCFLFLADVMFGRHRLNGFELPFAAAGVWLGLACWHIYEFMFEE